MPIQGVYIPPCKASTPRSGLCPDEGSAPASGVWQPHCITQVQNLEILSSKTNDNLSLASLELAEYSEKAFFVCQKSPDKQMVS
jgi:hypothetical protein